MGEVLHSPLMLFIVQAVLVIVSSRTIGIGARRLRQPMVIAEVIAGICLGPSLLGWLAPKAEAMLFPQTSMPLLSLMSQVGLVLFMFLIGLELDPKLLRGRARASVVISHTSIAVPFALGALLAFPLYPRLSPSSVRFTSFVLFMGVAMSITAFPVLARILVERRLLRTKVGTVTIACAAVDDVTAWCILAFVVATARSTGLFDAVKTTVLALAYMAFMLLVVRPFAARFAGTTRAGLSQNIVALLLVLLLGSSFLTELIGIHALFGAFLFGTVIPREGAFARHLAEKMEDLVVVLMLPLFFAYSGLRTQIGLLDHSESWLYCGGIIVAACVGKFGGSTVAARFTGLNWRESSAIGILMNTRGLVELIALNIGYDLGVISQTLFTMLVIMALVTTFMTTPILSWVYPIERLAKELAEPEETAPLLERAYTALLCVSFESAGPALLTVGAALAGKDTKRGRIYALSLAPPVERASSVIEQSEPTVSDATLAPLLARAKESSLHVRPMSFVSSQPAKDICDVAEVKRADVIVLGWHRPILGNAMLGGTVHDVMAGADTDVAVLFDRGLAKLERLLVPYLGSEHDRAALGLARRMAEATGARVTVLHVAPKEERSTVYEEIREGFATPVGGARAVELEIKVVRGKAPHTAALEEAAGGYDLSIVGVGNDWGLPQRAFGLWSEAILSRSPTSVLVVRAENAKDSAPRAERVSEEVRARFGTLPPPATTEE